MLKPETVFHAKKNPLKLALMFSFPFILIVVVLLVSLTLWEVENHNRDLDMELAELARAYYSQIMVTKLWNTEYGGVYVELADETKPNFHLSNPEKDVVFIAGRKYAKIDHAYMTQQISNIANRMGWYRFRITSLRPMNPANRPDEWEAMMLRSFEEGKVEGYKIVNTEGKKYLRYMAPLIIERPCLRCHRKEGYDFADIGGGVSIDIPINMTEEVHRDMIRKSIIAFIVVGVVSISFITGITWAFSKRISKGIESELEHERLKTAVQLAGAAAHELRQPMTVIIGLAETLKEKAAYDKPPAYEVDVIIGQCWRMNNIITRMLNITRYKTKTYDKDTEIFDLDE